MKSAFRLASIAAAMAALPTLVLPPPSAPAQETTQAAGQELVANLAAGEVVIAVVKDAILIATVENPIEQKRGHRHLSK